MWEKLRIVFTIPELRRKIFVTQAFLAIYRVGYQIPLPVVNQGGGSAEASQSGFGQMIEHAALFAASDLRQATIFGLGIMPYISASIIFQLLGTVWKPLEELRKEGETGRKKINEYTRYATVVLCLIQSTAYVYFYLMAVPEDGSRGMINEAFTYGAGSLTLHWGWMVVAIATMTCGTIFLMWLGEQIDEFGIGNGISLLIMAGIVAQMPKALTKLSKNSVFELVGLGRGKIGIESMLVLTCLFVAVVACVVFITQGQRRIPVQSAKHVRGRRQMGGQRSFLPLRINQAGVMPIIFASSLLMIPGLLFRAVTNWSGGATWAIVLANAFGSGVSLVYNLLYVGMIYFFCYFWTAITFNPKEMSEHLKDSGTFIPGYRPGKRTADYLEKVMVRITYVGAGFLAAVAIIPTIISSALGVDFTVASFYGGTGLLIAVSVAFDLVQKIDSHLVMRDYPGLLES